MRVSARIRPLLHNELTQEKGVEVVRKLQRHSFDNSISNINSLLLQQNQDTLRTRMHNDMICLHTNKHFKQGMKFFEFHHILDEGQSQQDVFTECQLQDLCDAFLKRGQNCNVMVYGPTNSGKTYTMLGN